ncbi:MAG: aryl-sulfate sulfotransferase [Candidatus Stahlbacteria bacterium]|nr:aryl-sulfate sulfotransferase [Candidatus Stahlbacteria bacterium]
MKIRTIGCLILISLSWSVMAEKPPYEGWTLFNRGGSTRPKLIDINGSTVNTWQCAEPTVTPVYLLPDSTLLRPSEVAGTPMNGAAEFGRIQRITWGGTVLWDYEYYGQNYQPHHDICPMPNGNVLVICWERKTQAEAQAMGRQSISGEMWPEKIVEVEPVGATEGNIVWEWHSWDHLIQDVDPLKPNYGVVAEHPELLDINYGTLPPGNGDWIHANFVDYNEALDQIVFSSHTISELYIIDHSTTTSEAASHTGGNSGMGGDFLYRWGNPRVYNRGDSSDQHFYVIHGVNWIDPGLPGEGNILAFNNGDRTGTSNDYSIVEEIVPPLNGYNYYIAPDSAFGPAEPVWIYSDPGTFYSQHLAGAQRLPNGNTLIVEATDNGKLWEVTSSGAIDWSYSIGGQTTNAFRYGWDYFSVEEGEKLKVKSVKLEVYPNPFTQRTTINYQLPSETTVSLKIYDITGRIVKTLVNGEKKAGSYSVNFDANYLTTGIYFVKLVAGAPPRRDSCYAPNYRETKKLIIVR